MTRLTDLKGLCANACRAWRNTVHRTLVSNFQADVSATLNAMGVAHTMEYETEVRWGPGPPLCSLRIV